MSIFLKNDFLQLHIQKPGELYKSSRFDWTGQIVQITYKNKHTFCTDEAITGFSANTMGKGLYNEFGIDQAIGYHNCPVGEKYPKIGIGLLTRETNAEYDFYKPHPVTPAEISFSSNENSISFICKSNEYRGFAYQLKKEIVLLKNTFFINYELENTGGEAIKTNEYVHNFLAINGKPVNEHYILYFPFQLFPDRFGETVNPDQVVQFKSKSITWKDQPTDQFFFSQINCGRKKGIYWSLEHETEKVSIKESVNFDILRFNLWGSSHVVSPEIFYNIDIKPGQTTFWQRHYEIFEK